MGRTRDVSKILTSNTSILSLASASSIYATQANFSNTAWTAYTPAIKGDMTLSTTGVKANGTGILRETCGDGYYLEITDLTISIPENIFDSNELTKIAEELMIAVSDLTFGTVDLRKKLLDKLNDTVSKQVMKALNEVLDDTKIAPAGC